MRILVGIAIAAAALAAGLWAVASWVLTPELLEERLLARLEERTGVNVDVSDLSIALDGIELEGVEVRAPATTGAPDAPRGDARPDPLLRVDRVTVRPELRPLLSGRVVIPAVEVEGLALAIRRDASGATNAGRAWDAIATPDTPAERASAEPGAFSVDVDRVTIDVARIDYVDEFERPGRPLRVTAKLERVALRDLRQAESIPFELAGEVAVGEDTASDVSATGTLSPSPLTVDADLELREVDVDSLVPALRKPVDTPGEPGPLPLEGVDVSARLRIGLVRYEGFEFRNATGRARLHDTALSVPELGAKIAGGRVKVSSEIDFGVQGFRYSGTARVRNVRLAEAGGLLRNVEWGSLPPTASGEVSLSMAGTSVRRLLDTISLEAEVQADAIDLSALGPRERTPGEVGPWDTGAGRFAATLRVARVRVAPWELEDLRAHATLENDRVALRDVAATAAGGDLTGRGHVDLSRPGLAWGGNATLAGASLETATAKLDRKRWGERSGAFGLQAEFTSAGTDRETVLSRLRANGSVSWTDGRIRDSLYLRRISDRTGIPGFRDLAVTDSGGEFRIRDGVFSSDRMTLWGPDAGIQAAGRIERDGRVDAEVALGIGPNSNRELFSTGIVLPYVQGEHGWRFVPLRVTGSIEDPRITIPPKAVLRSALTTIPSASLGIVQKGVGATRSVTDEVLGGRNPVLRGGRTVVDGGLGIVERGSDTVGSLLGGIGSLFGGGSGKTMDPPPESTPTPSPRR